VKIDNKNNIHRIYYAETNYYGRYKSIYPYLSIYTGYDGETIIDVKQESIEIDAVSQRDILLHCNLFKHLGINRSFQLINIKNSNEFQIEVMGDKTIRVFNAADIDNIPHYYGDEEHYYSKDDMHIVEHNYAHTFTYHINSRYNQLIIIYARNGEIIWKIYNYNHGYIYPDPEIEEIWLLCHYFMSNNDNLEIMKISRYGGLSSSLEKLYQHYKVAM
jgi:hypothetical protein